MDVMTVEGLFEILEEWEDEHALKMDGFDDCIIGLGEVGGNFQLIYSEDLIMEKLMTMDMDYEGAQEYYSFNIQGSCVGDGQPLIQIIKIVRE